MKNILTAVLCVSFVWISFGQKNRMGAVEIYKKIRKLNFFGSVMYIAAHPDDENTEVITYFSNKVHARTAYLSLTRGDGGQNLIGKEIGDLLGVLRSEELLKARSIDGGEQYFANAIDFGYSKNSTETFKIWNKDKVIEDIVRIIRKFRPDVIINRFSTKAKANTHGHHTASAIASVEAFSFVDKSDFLPEVPICKPGRLFLNNYDQPDEESGFSNLDKSKYAYIDTGIYYPILGRDNAEIAAESRSLHRFQGFNAKKIVRGEKKEYFELILGEPIENNDIFSGIDTSWTRIPEGEAIGSILDEVQANFNFQNPSGHITDLIRSYKLIKNIEDDYWREIKTSQILEIIRGCLGLHLQAVSTVPGSTRDIPFSVLTEAINRSDVPVILKSVGMGSEYNKNINTALNNNEKISSQLLVSISENIGYTTPYWLLEAHGPGNYSVGDKDEVGQPHSPRICMDFVLEVFGERMVFREPIVYSTVDPSEGQSTSQFEVVPDITVNFSEEVYVFSNANPKHIHLKIKAFKDDINTFVSLQVPYGWLVSPKEAPVKIDKKYDEIEVSFFVSPTRKGSVNTIYPRVKNHKKIYSEYELKYEHINNLLVLMPTRAKAVNVNIKKEGNHIGYTDGAGDKIPESLEQIGYRVTKIIPSEITLKYLKTFDAIVMGVRAYNILKDFEKKQEILLEYVKNGGTLVVQYNSTGWLSMIDTKNFSPYYLNISRDRVTEEDSPVVFLKKRHPILNKPNNITAKDFEGWVQERGLYFPNKWDESFEPILSMNDTGDHAKEGALLVASYGSGHYVYTGLSFFRQLPAGVPGAYRLFVNLLSLSAY